MSMKRNIVIDGQEVAFRASAAIPRIYRMRFHRDIFKDLKDLEKGIDKNDPENSSLDLFSLEMFENIAYVMAKHCRPFHSGYAGGMAGRLQHFLHLSGAAPDH